jgi:hypothetical protein
MPEPKGNAPMRAMLTEIARRTSDLNWVGEVVAKHQVVLLA